MSETTPATPAPFSRATWATQLLEGEERQGQGLAATGQLTTTHIEASAPPAGEALGGFDGGEVTRAE